MDNSMRPPPPTGVVPDVDVAQPVAHYEQPIHQQQVAIERARFRLLEGEQKPLLGIAMGLLAAVIGAVIWATVALATGHQTGWMAIGVGVVMAIGVGAMVGFAVRLGRGVDLYFGVIGAVVALMGCALGNVLTMAGFTGAEKGVDVLQVLGTLDYAKVPEMLIGATKPMDLLFYGIAIVVGFRCSFRRYQVG